MNAQVLFWKLEALSDRQLLERMRTALGSSRRVMAELLAHLGEVEERRLHLAAACSSMFAYCLKLGMTEDEAYRRIEVARLARRYPTIFALLADGQLTISVVALLKHYLSDENHQELLAAVAGKSVGQTRELIAARFPRPDVASSVRKLPEPVAARQPSLALSEEMKPNMGGMEACLASSVPEPCAPRTGPHPGSSTPRHLQGTTQPRVASRIEPLSAQRYEVQLTGTAELARKLELARDLMRHSHSSGDLGPIVERALDLLIESLMKRRFGKNEDPKRTSARAERSHTAEPDTATTAGTTGSDTATTAGTTGSNTAKPDNAGPVSSTLDSADIEANARAELKQRAVPAYIPRSTRRAVVERDGLGCSWVDEHGTRCASRAWLEYDHRRPRAKSGGSERDNVRLLCRHHNRFEAERAYGRQHVEQSIAEHRRKRAEQHREISHARCRG